MPNSGFETEDRRFESVVFQVQWTAKPRLSVFCVDGGAEAMTKDELLRLLLAHEDNFVERKLEGAATGELRQTVSAFANTVPDGRTAVLFLGIHDKTGAVLGVENPKRSS